MHWKSLADFLAMGSHGLYVWGSLLVMAALMIAEPMFLVHGRRTLLTRLRRQFRAEQSEAGERRPAKRKRPSPPTSPQE